MTSQIYTREQLSSMDQIRLTEGTSIVLGATMVQLIKQKKEGYRVTFVPRNVVELSLLHGAAFDQLTGEEGEEICIGNLDEWMLSVTTFKKHQYMCYTKVDNTGTKLRWLSTNVERDVYREMRNRMVGFDAGDWEDTVDMEFVQPTPPQMNVYYGSLENIKTGIQRVCTERYLDRGACELATYAAQDPSKVEKVVIKTSQIPVPTCTALMKDVYQYMILNAYETTVKANCYGCTLDRQSQKDHLSMGCLEDRDVLIEMYGQSCHDSIKPGQFMMALTVMCGEFKIKNGQTVDSVVKFLREVNYADVLSTHKLFVYEFDKINGL